MTMLKFDQFPKYKKIAILNQFLRYPTTMQVMSIKHMTALKNRLLKHSPDTQVDALNSTPSKALKYLSMKNCDADSYDCVVFFNPFAQQQFYGGQMSKQVYYVLDFMRQFKGDIYFYLECPSEGFFPKHNYIDLVKKYMSKEGRYNQLCAKAFSEDDLDKMTAKFQNLNFICDFDISNKLTDKTPYLRNLKQGLEEGRIHAYDASVTRELSLLVACSDGDYATKKYDLNIATRIKQREDIIRNCIDRDGLKVEVIGDEVVRGGYDCKVKRIHTIGNVVNYYRHIVKSSLASLVVLNEGDGDIIVPERLYSVLGSYVVGMIPLQCDPHRRMIKSEELADFCYVTDSEDTYNKMQRLKDKQFYDHIIGLQREELKTLMK